MWPTFAFVALVAIALPLLLGSVSLRVGGIAFAMVTLAFAQAGEVLVHKNPKQWTNGEEGLGLNFDPLPDFFVGVLNTKNLYWLALGVCGLRLRRRALCGRELAGPRAAGDPRERAARRGDRAAALRLQADRVRARVVPRERGRRRLPAAERRRDAGGDDRQLHSDAARDGRDRRCGDALRRAARRLPLHACRPAARLARGLVARREAARGAGEAALGAALRPRDDLHPARLLRSRRAREPRPPVAPCCGGAPASKEPK